MPWHIQVRALPRLVAVAIALTFAPLAYSQSLLQIYREALANDPTYASARALYQSQTERIPQARAGLLPIINATGNITNQRNEITYNDGSNLRISQTQRGIGLNLTQPLFRWQNWETYQQAELQVAAAQANFVQSQQDLVVRVAQAYFDVLASQDSLAFTRAQKAAIAEQLASAKRNFEVGTATVVEQNDAQARSDLVTAQEIAAANDLQVRRTALEQIIGKSPGDLIPLRAQVELPGPTPSAVEPWIQSAETSNTNVRVAQANAEIARREISKQRGGHYPTVDAVGIWSSTKNPVGIPASNSEVRQIGVQATIPLFAGGGTQARVREAIALDEQARSNLEAAKRGAVQSARQNYLGVTNGLAQVKALEAAEVSSQTSLDANRLGYKVGAKVNIDVLNAQQQLFQTRRDLSRARYDTLVQGLRLKAATGQLQESDLQAIDALLGS